VRCGNANETSLAGEAGRQGGLRKKVRAVETDAVSFYFPVE
jgi:hypothetical protein